MAIFKKSKKENKKVKEAKAEAPVRAESTTIPRAYAHVLLSPRVTEKASELSGRNAYVFNVSPRAGKKDIAAAILAVYKISPISIATIQIPGKKTNMRGRKGKTASGKKAIVVVKSGEKIEFI